jgi:MoaA/NifB/PqqE/SkfB family radical SAM enzyme
MATTGGLSVGSGHGGQSLWLELTPNCNWSCLFCYNPWRPEDRKDFPAPMTFDQLVQVLERLIERVDFDYIALSGGEPLLYRRLDELIGWLCERSSYPILTTNGSLLSKPRVERLKDAGLQSIQVSLMSLDAATHDQLAGTRSWREAVRGICNSIELRLNLSVVFTATKVNVGGLTKLIRFLSELGVQRVILNQLQLGGSAIPNAEALVLDHGSFIEAVEDTKVVASANGVEVVPVPPLNHEDLPVRCPWSRWAVGPGGELKICNLSKASLGDALVIPDPVLDRAVSALARGELEPYSDLVDTCTCFDRRMSLLRQRGTPAKAGI